MKNNELYERMGLWRGDGSQGVVTETASTVNLSSATQGSPFHTIYDTADYLLLGDFYFQVKILELDGNFSVGLITKGEFEPGWKAKGMFYNGNLTNCGGALQTSFGPYIKQGMEIGVLYKGSGVYFYVNQQCLGKAFQLDTQTPRNRYPCLSVTGKAQVEWSAPQAIPTERDRATASTGPYKGDWKLGQLVIHSKDVTLPLRAIVATITERGDCDSSTCLFNLSIKVGNTLSTQLKLSTTSGETNSVIVGPIISTRMMPPPELYAIETNLSRCLPNVSQIIATKDSKKLVLAGPTVELVLHPFVKVFAPLVDYH
jgi:hypothetical protein